MNPVPLEQAGDFIIKNTAARLGPRWGAHRDWEDIQAEAHLLAWISYQRARENQACLPTTAAIHALSWGPGAWFRRERGQAGNQAPILGGECLEYGFIPHGQVAAEEGPPALLPALLTADFTGASIAQLDAVALTGQVLSQLPVPQREALWLHWGEGLTLRETAARLDCPLGTVHSRLWHGLKRCRQLLGLVALPPPRAPKPALPTRPPRKRPEPATCPAGHPWIAQNWHRDARGYRHCRLCREVPRPEFCRQGHEWTPENTLPGSNGTRLCRACRRDAVRRHDARRRPPFDGRPLDMREQRRAKEQECPA